MLLLPVTPDLVNVSSKKTKIFLLLRKCEARKPGLINRKSFKYLETLDMYAACCLVDHFFCQVLDVASLLRETSSCSCQPGPVATNV